VFNETRRVSLPMAAALAAIATLLSCSRAAIHAQTMALPPQGLQSGQQPDLNGVRAQPSMLLQQAGHDDVMRTDLGVENVDGSQNQRSPIFPSPSYLPSPVADARAQSIDPGLAGFPEKNQVRGSWDIIDATRVSVSARGGIVYDSTRMNPAAQGYFFPSAIPVRGDPFFGSGNQTTVQGNGSSIGLSAGSSTGAVSGVFAAEVAAASNAEQAQLSIRQAYFVWSRWTFGVTDTTFHDGLLTQEDLNFVGPNGIPSIRNSTAGLSNQPLVAYRYLGRDADSNNPDRSGFYGNIAVEAPGADVFEPSLTAAHFATFSRYPDLVVNFRYQNMEMVTDPVGGKPTTLDHFHLQFAALVRDLGVEEDGTPGFTKPRQTTTGWGANLSGQIELFHTGDKLAGKQDYLMFSVTFGDGVGHYFPDLHFVSAVNDAAYNTISRTQ